MPNPIVECIPNFSEARRPEVVTQILAAFEAVPGVHILDRHSDLDHNRTVITLVGAPAAVEEAAFQAIARAAKLINLDEHTGAHPRLGATDVVPFVPISDVSMQECVEMARRLGKRVGSELNIPVYLYEDAASIPERTNLENIRRGQYEALKEELGVRPERNPDFGPTTITPAGATVIGARQPLIAFNVYLTTNDTTIAQKIAKAVRHSSGGMRFVKGMGVLVEGRAQVSMNMTNYRQTPLARVVEMIRREAERYGVGIHHSELVGLIPQEALNDAATWYMQLDGFSIEQILEQRMMELMRNAPTTQSTSEASFLDELASANPTPGGGSAAAHTGAAAAALVAMVGRVTLGKKKYEVVKKQMWELVEKAEALRADLTAGVQADADSFVAVMNAYKLPKDTPEQNEVRNRAVQSATLAATQVPLGAAHQCLAVQELALQAVELGNLNAISDAASGATLARSALTCAAYNVRINVGGLEDETLKGQILTDMRSVENRSVELETRLHSLL
ncbi:MAG TPA: glutamate formimidoyltransferase, partial [Bellilinea sp.]|nr:glutamate formimidoyltransferase [Bellilinea sp.]